MAQARVGKLQPNRSDESVFECEFCGARRLSRVVSYDDLGYPVCPACEYEQRP